MNTPVKFELAKLLKEKGFDLPTYKSYRISVNPELPIAKEPITDKNTYFPNVKESYPAPTIAQIIMWLYEKHGVWIYTRPVLDEDGEWIFKGYVKLMNHFKAKEYQTKLLRKPTEAYEIAIEYCLTKLI